MQERELRITSPIELSPVAETAAPVLVADPDDDARAALASLLRTSGYAVVEATSGEEALAAARATPPCAALLEVPLGGLSGYEVCRTLHAELGESVPVMFVSGVRTESYDRVAGLLVGASDYLVKPYAPDELLTRVRNLLRRSRPLPAMIFERLTRREREVLTLLADGLRQDEIAARLFITKKTVGTHVVNMLRKLGVRSQAQAVAMAYRGELRGAVEDDFSLHDGAVARLPSAVASDDRLT
jgi:DNA-binding NarL/FixJ family response regulator